jgi:phenylacetate-CoA ligase
VRLVIDGARVNESFARHLYYSLQRGRGGVDPEQVQFARRLLDAPWSSVQTHVRERLVALHGPDAQSTDWLAGQRLVTRTELVPRMRDLMKNSNGVKVEHRKTSGSTGTPFHFVKDVRMTAWMDATMWAAYSWYGVQPGDRQARFWGAPITAGAGAKRVLLDRVQNRRRLSAFKINRESSAAFLARLRRFRATYAYGYPTLIDEFVTHCSAQGLDGRDLRLRVIICTGELLLPAARERIKAFFGCPVVNEYGCSESGVLAFECVNEKLHITPVAAFPEIVSGDGAPLAPGTVGEVVVTDLYGAVEPFVHYRLHDRAAVTAPALCACGRELPTLAVQEGRIDSFISTPRGRVYDAVLAYTVPAEVFRFRARQVALDRLEVDVVPGKGFDPQRTPRDCEHRWAEALGPGMTVVVNTVNEIPLTAAGKLRYFVPLSVVEKERAPASQA